VLKWALSQPSSQTALATGKRANDGARMNAVRTKPRHKSARFVQFVAGELFVFTKQSFRLPIG
jgi:hypothetical protein